MMSKFVCFFFLITSVCFGYQYELSVCMIFRDEAPYLKEWIEFHRLVGVEHFYLCNHSSKDHYREVLEPYISEGIVELKEFIEDDPDKRHHGFFRLLQRGHFSDIIEKSRGISKWVAFIDSDEFLVPVHHDSLVELLKDYEEFGGVCPNWHVFGTSNIDVLTPERLMIEQLICCSSAELNSHIKSIVQPDRVITYPHPHIAKYKDGFFQVNTDKEKFLGPHNIPVLFDKLKINHYYTRDNSYFWNVKVPRQIQLRGQAETIIKQYPLFNETEDFTIQRFVPKLRERMNYTEID